MTPTLRLFAFGLLACLAAGCAGPAAPTEAATPQALAPQALLLDGCDSVYTNPPLLPNAVSPARPPPGWEMPATQPFSSVGLLAFDCARVAVGPFERGPIRLVADVHSNFEAPPACVADARPPTTSFVLHTLFVDDVDLAAYLALAYDLPAFPGDIRVGSDPARGPMTQRTWTWGAPGKPASELTFADGGDRRADPGAYRLFWTRGPGIGSLDLAYERQSTGGMVGTGEMREPMLLAGLPGGRYAGSLTYATDLSAQGALRLYEDTACRGLEP